ncbi:MAG: hypothetical protein JW927_04635 [Deltaproteobacteria bacterium]|nr:hypothetical protein [Deltaproteobacteria bacterium]
MEMNINRQIVSKALLPKALETGEEGEAVHMILNSHLNPVKPGSDFILPTFGLSQAILNALYSARRTNRLIQGLEEADKKLEAERAGIVQADNKTGASRNERISRLAVIANDGSERYYREVKKLVKKNFPRMLALYIDATSYELGERLFGPGKRALFLLVNHKDAVINLLKSLII